MLNHLERIGKKTLGERIVDEKIRHEQQMRGARMFGPISLQSPKVISIAQFRPQLLENPPVSLRSLRADLAGEPALQICCHSVVIKERVVYIEQKDDGSRRIIVFVHFLGGGQRCALSSKCLARATPKCNSTFKDAIASPYSASSTISATATVRPPNSARTVTEP